MGTFKSFMDSSGISPQQIEHTSKRIEANDETSRALLIKRAAKRRSKDEATKKYAELGIEKPKHHGRGVSQQQVVAAIGDVAVARKVRSKILRAVNVILVKNKKPEVDMKVLFEGTKARAGKKPVTAQKK